MPTPFRVALLVETARGYGRAFLRGVVRYARIHGPWSFYLTPGDFEQVLPRMRAWRGTGIIARIENARVARAIVQSGLPTIVLDLADARLRSGSALAGLSEIATDSLAVGRMAAEHLLGRGLRHLAFVGLPDRAWSSRRQDGFTHAARAAGLSPFVYPLPRSRRAQEWGNEQPLLAQWLSSLPRPAGILACNDDRGRQVLEACRAAGLDVPTELAVLGVDDDDLLCELSDPPLSSIALDAEAGGFQAAALLHRMMRRTVRSPRRLLVPPVRVITRRSSDLLVSPDPLVRDALRFLVDHATEPIGVPHLVSHLMVSRRLLETRFKAATGRTIRQEIERLRLDRARLLLLETDLPIPRIAQAVGLGGASYLAEVFRRHDGCTPAAYRRRHRAVSTHSFET